MLKSLAKIIGRGFMMKNSILVFCFAVLISGMQVQATDSVPTLPGNMQLGVEIAAENFGSFVGVLPYLPGSNPPPYAQYLTFTNGTPTLPDFGAFVDSAKLVNLMSQSDIAKQMAKAPNGTYYSTWGFMNFPDTTNKTGAVINNLPMQMDNQTPIVLQPDQQLTPDLYGCQADRVQSTITVTTTNGVSYPVTINIPNVPWRAFIGYGPSDWSDGKNSTAFAAIDSYLKNSADPCTRFWYARVYLTAQNRLASLSSLGNSNSTIQFGEDLNYKFLGSLPLPTGFDQQAQGEASIFPELNPSAGDAGCNNNLTVASQYYCGTRVDPNDSTKNISYNFTYQPPPDPQTQILPPLRPTYIDETSDNCAHYNCYAAADANLIVFFSQLINSSLVLVVAEIPTAPGLDLNPSSVETQALEVAFAKTAENLHNANSNAKLGIIYNQ